ncbi:cysteine hydrolase [Marinococcus halophilus]|uniref:Putative isochorismatase family protein YaaI n=1 Tax=Marinococcus halophilus TaxID=1371 RepID=A0A510Y833_MARHA|nr:isochorismatase family cysteine hydrolase [Marinococcus halophilus]OZT79443.1 cysteine hydrolase [Marinococcus halophilus]GEK59525.1 putative isochorismatase family protein YaaI [Marinococcus halophilus]
MAKEKSHVNQQSSVAFVVLDMINDLDFPDSDDLLPHALDAAESVKNLKKQAKEKDIPVIYVNDNYGRWQSNFPDLVEYCRRDDAPGKPVVEKILPDDDDYYILKPQFSGFFATPLELLLNNLEVTTIIFAGVAGNMCVHFTVNDAYMRGYKLMVPQDCTASNSMQANEEAINLMSKVLGADTRDSTEYDLEKIIQEAQELPQPSHSS